MATTRNPVKYAEEELGVHETYSELEQATHEAAALRGEVALVENNIRNTEATIEAREFDVLSDLRSEWTGSEASFDRALKIALGDDAKLRELRFDVLYHRTILTTKRAELANAEARVKNKRARVYELGDLLRFYAAGKDAVTVARVLVRDPLNNWP